jgi:hypothetical protein
MLFRIRASDAVFDDAHVIVPLERVAHGPHDADVRVDACDEQRFDSEVSKQQVEIRAEEATITALLDPQIARAWRELVDDLNSRCFLDAMRRHGRIRTSAGVPGSGSFVGLPAGIDPARSVRLLREDDGNPCFSSCVHDMHDGGYDRLRPRCVAAGILVEEVTLHVDNEECGSSVNDLGHVQPSFTLR